MITRIPIQAKSTARILRAIFPEQFKMVNDKTSNGYKFINLLYGVEIDEARRQLQKLYDNSFLETLDLSEEGELYEVILSGQINNSYLNSTTSGSVPIKVTNLSDGLAGEVEFYNGPPTRVIPTTSLSISGIVYSGGIIGLEYFRENPSGYGYLLINSDITQSAAYSTGSGSTWRLDLDNRGTVLTNSGSWPGIDTQSFAVQGADDLLTPLISSYLNDKYPLTRTIIDDSGVQWDIDHYEPYRGWVRDEDWDVVAYTPYSGDYYYDTQGNKIYYRTAFNNPYGSGNYNTAYVMLANIPISGTLKLYDIDILDNSGNAVQIPQAGKDLYYLQSPDMLEGTSSGTWDPKYVGYDQLVPTDRGFGQIEGQLANTLNTVSWDYQKEGGGIDEGTMQYMESSSGSLTNMLKISNPWSRYIAEYKFELYKKAKYITSLEGTRYLSLDTANPTYSLQTVTNNEEEIPYEYTRNPNRVGGDKFKFISFYGWKIRPNSRMSKVDFKIPIELENGSLDQLNIVTARREPIGYTEEFVPIFDPDRRYRIRCPFDRPVSLGTVTEQDLTGNAHNFDWTNTGGNEIYRFPFDGNYAKKIKYVNASGYYKIDSTDFVKPNTFFYFKFRAPVKNELTLMELKQQTENIYIKLSIKENGLIKVEGDGIELYSRYRFSFDSEWKELILRYYPDQEFTTDHRFELFINDPPGYTKLNPFQREIDNVTISDTYIHLCQNCTMDIDTFKLYYEATDNGSTS